MRRIGEFVPGWAGATLLGMTTIGCAGVPAHVADLRLTRQSTTGLLAEQRDPTQPLTIFEFMDALGLLKSLRRQHFAAAADLDS